MKLIKISPKSQITIPRDFRKYCATGWLSASCDGSVLILRPVEIQEAQTDQEIMEEIFRPNGGDK